MDEDFDKLTEDIITKQDLVYLLDDINQARELVFKKEETALSEKAEDVISREMKEIFKQQEEQGNLQTRQQQDDFLDKLSEYLQELPQLKLTLGFSPSDNFLQEVSQWLKNNAGQKIIVNLIVKPEIVGGAIIEYQGRYLNNSLAKKIDQLASH